jgi:hypothetical protein
VVEGVSAGCAKLYGGECAGDHMKTSSVVTMIGVVGPLEILTTFCDWPAPSGCATAFLFGGVAVGSADVVVCRPEGCEWVGSARGEE